VFDNSRSEAVEPDSAVDYAFWIAVALLAHSYVGYPLLLAVASRLHVERPSRAQESEVGADVPPVAVVLSALNEQVHIADRIANLLSQNYSGQLTVYVGSDGSTDRTAQILAAFSGERVRTFIFSQRLGKATVLNELMRHVTEPITIFSDANVVFEPDAVRALVRSLRDRAVGAVCGELVLHRRSGTINQDSAYWRMERLLKAAEGRLGILLGANGAIYAIRTALYEPLPADTIIDDFVIGMRITVRGRRLVYEPSARAFEETPERIEDEFRRRVRIGLGNFQALFRYPEFIYRSSLPRAVAYISHKVLRWFTPHLLLCALIASALLAAQPFYAGLFGLQLVGYAVIGTAAVVRNVLPVPRLLLGVVLFAGVNAAFGVAFCRYFAGDLRGKWSRTERSSK
jgi:cellulose synthase/poly-beta-1,6-N-acetylglucosamine synthase-like glycosyltransferase